MTVEERENKAVDFFMGGYNCCQAVALAFADVMGLDENTVKKLSSGFGGGMGRMREVCGAVSGMVMVAGFIEDATDPSDHASRTKNYALIQDFANKFKEQKGSIICRDLLCLRAEEKKNESPEPSERSQSYYHSRPCALCVAAAARIVAEHLSTI